MARISFPPRFFFGGLEWVVGGYLYKNQGFNSKSRRGWLVSSRVPQKKHPCNYQRKTHPFVGFSRFFVVGIGWLGGIEELFRNGGSQLPWLFRWVFLWGPWVTFFRKLPKTVVLSSASLEEGVTPTKDEPPPSCFAWRSKKHEIVFCVGNPACFQVIPSWWSGFEFETLVLVEGKWETTPNHQTTGLQTTVGLSVLLRLKGTRLVWFHKELKGKIAVLQMPSIRCGALVSWPGVFLMSG